MGVDVPGTALLDAVQIVLLRQGESIQGFVMELSIGPILLVLGNLPSRLGFCVALVGGVGLAVGQQAGGQRRDEVRIRLLMRSSG